MNDDVVDEVVPVGVAEHLRPERAGLLEVDCAGTRSVSEDPTRCDTMGIYSRSVTKLSSVLAWPSQTSCLTLSYDFGLYLQAATISRPGHMRGQLTLT